nr:hypothetical protein [Tanacetum cinerariifolium]
VVGLGEGLFAVQRYREKWQEKVYRGLAGNSCAQCFAQCFKPGHGIGGFATALAVLITRASQSRQHGKSELYKARLVGDGRALQYLTITRLDISYAVQQICLHMHDLHDGHMAAMKCILQYIQGADKHPPMLEKDMYDSWKSITELYMMNRQHGRMILESVENGPLIWPSIEENRVTRPKKYSELSNTKAIQADFKENRVTRPKKYSELSSKEAIQPDCDVKAINIILQGLPPEVVRGEVKVLHVPSRYQIEDILTKGLPRSLRDDWTLIIIFNQ